MNRSLSQHKSTLPACYRPVHRLRRIHVTLIVMVVALFSNASLAAPAPRAAIVKASEVVEKMIAPTTWVPGTVISRNDARLAAEVAGRLESVAEVGTEFKKGDVIVRIDDITTKLALAEAKARVVKEKARLKFLKNEVTRLEELARQNSAAKTQLDQALSERDVADSELAVAQVQVDHAKEELARTSIRAPFDGVVTQRMARTGERVDKGDIVVRFVDAGTYEIQARVPHSSIAHISRGSVLGIDVGSQTLQATVRTLVPVGDDQSRLYDVRLIIEGPGWSVGQTLRVAVPTAQAKNAVVVPRDALVMRRNGIAVFKITEENKVERVPVKTGVANGSVIEVIGNILPGQRVVVRGGERLRPGQSVNVLPGGA